MTSLVDLYAESESENVFVFFCPMEDNIAISSPDGYVGIDVLKLNSYSEEKVCLAHELGHCITGSFYNIYSDLDIRQKHENTADKWAIKKLVPLDELREAINNGIDKTWELAEYFRVTEEFIEKAIFYYTIVKGVII